MFLPKTEIDHRAIIVGSTPLFDKDAFNDRPDIRLFDMYSGRSVPFKFCVPFSRLLSSMDEKSTSLISRLYEKNYIGYTWNGKECSLITTLPALSSCKLELPILLEELAQSPSIVVYIVNHTSSVVTDHILDAQSVDMDRHSRTPSEFMIGASSVGEVHKSILRNGYDFVPLSVDLFTINEGDIFAAVKLFMAWQGDDPVFSASMSKRYLNTMLDLEVPIVWDKWLNISRPEATFTGPCQFSNTTRESLLTIAKTNRELPGEMLGRTVGHPINDLFLGLVLLNDSFNYHRNKFNGATSAEQFVDLGYLYHNQGAPSAYRSLMANKLAFPSQSDKAITYLQETLSNFNYENDIAKAA